MAQLSKTALNKIVARDLPGYEVMKRNSAADRAAHAAADEVAPDISKLRQKYLGKSAPPNADSAKPAADSKGPAANTDDEIVVVQRRNTDNPFDHPSRPKTVVVSGKSKRVIGSQG